MAQRLLSTLGFLICSAFLTLTVLAQPQDLNALRASYANGKERIDAAAQNQRESALRLYGVEIDSFLEDLKKDGDIATYTVVEKERNRFRAEKTVPITSANSRIGKAITAYQTKMADVAASADSETAQLLTKCITDLADLIKDLMQKNKIEDAKAAGVVRKNLEALLARVEGGRQPPNPVIEPAVKKPETVTAKAADSQKPTKSDAGKEPVVDKVVQSDDLSSSKYTPVSTSVDLGNGVTLEMVWCPAGRFIIGAQKGEQGYKENEPQHQVTLSKGFWIGKTEVTQAQWESVMGRNPSYFKGPEKPVESVSWDRALAVAPLPSSGHKPRRLNFVGGEPTVCPHLEELVLEASLHGLRVSIVSNGFKLVEKGLPPAFRSLELLGLSIDSLDAETNARMGRAVCGRTISAAQWMRLFEEAGRMGLPVKINTVVNVFNRNESMASFIAEEAPLRWKVLQAITVEGQNSHCSQEWVVDRDTFDRYVDRHVNAGVRPVVESEEVMRGSYAMISPDGRFYDSTSGSHRYSDPILAVGVEKAWGQVTFNNQKFDARTRSYGEESVVPSRICAAIR